ncbi:hypothetical protein ZIOFF_007274 [Zingiber officinale]|uniref:non-specific serine/threonine protein kinase n=1 Tax=Zingiber officinale TaxID=94328 RepID=A0A8J5I3M3_ZINOF|nr:hypothetical protein ZIOFF_007274 [Zingiber officinale]
MVRILLFLISFFFFFFFFFGSSSVPSESLHSSVLGYSSRFFCNRLWNWQSGKNKELIDARSPSPLMGNGCLGSSSSSRVRLPEPSSNRRTLSHSQSNSSASASASSSFDTLIATTAFMRFGNDSPATYSAAVASGGFYVLRHPTPNILELYALGRKLGQGQFGTTYLCTELATGSEYACKSIAKRKLISKEDVEDVRREIQILHHLSGHKNVVTIKGAFEDAQFVHIVMELCAGGELFDRIIERGHYSERKAAELIRIIVGVIEACHSLGVMHRDLKPENFLLVNRDEDSSLKLIDFGLSVFFKPGEERHNF